VIDFSTSSFFESLLKRAAQVDNFIMNNLSIPEGRQRQLISECAPRQQFRVLTRFGFSQAHKEFGRHDQGLASVLRNFGTAPQKKSNRFPWRFSWLLNTESQMGQKSQPIVHVLPLPSGLPCGRKWLDPYGSFSELNY
jgi:hypothetical protein